MHNGCMNPLLSRTAALALVALAFVGLGMLPAAAIPSSQNAGARLAYFEDEDEAWNAGLTESDVDPSYADYIAGQPGLQPVLRFDDPDGYVPAVRYIEPEVYVPWPSVDAAAGGGDMWRDAEMAPIQPYMTMPQDITTGDILDSMDDLDEMEEMDRLEEIQRGREYDPWDTPAHGPLTPSEYEDECAEHGCDGDTPWWLVPEEETCARYGDCENAPLGYQDEDEDEVAYTRMGRLYEEDEAPWYEDVVPVRSWGCTYFGSGCEGEETRYSVTYRADESRSSGSSWGGTFYQSLFGGSSGGSSGSSYSIPVNSVSPSYTNNAPEPRPQCSIRMSPSNADYGTHIFVSWDSVNAVKAQIDGMGNIPTNGFHGFTATENKTLTMRVYGERGTLATCSAQLIVVGAQSAQCSLAANPSRIASGAPVQLRWVVPNAVRVELSNFGPAPSEGSLTVYPDRTTTYAIRAIGRDGKQTSCNTTVQVGNTTSTTGSGNNGNTESTNNNEEEGLGAEFYRFFGVDINRQR